MYVQRKTLVDDTLDASYLWGELYLNLILQHSLFREINGVVRCKGTPSQPKSNDRRAEAQDTCSRDIAWSIPPRTRIEIFSGQSQDDQKYNRHGDPRVPLVRMYISVPDKTGHESQNCNNNDGCRAGDPGLVAFAHRSESQSTGDAIDRAPSNACNRI